MRKLLKWITLPLWILPAIGLFSAGFCLGKLFNIMNGGKHEIQS